MSFEFFIAVRYLRSKGRSRYLSFLTAIATGAVFISVFSFLIIHAVMNGFSTHLKEALIGFDHHIIVSSFAGESRKSELMGWLRQKKGISEMEDVVECDAILLTAEGESAGVKIRGGDFSALKEGKIGKIEPLFFDDADAGWEKGEPPPVLLGEEIYSRLHFFPGQEQAITLVYPFGDVGPAGDLEPRSRTYRIAGVFKTGFFGVDSRYLLMSNKEAGWLSGFDPASLRLKIQMRRLNGAPALADGLRKNFPDVKVETWIEKNRRLFSALKLERAGMFLLLGIVILIATFNIFALVILLSLNKSREIALLCSLGLAPSRVKLIFIFSGLALGTLGTGLGFFAGMGLLQWFKSHPLMLPSAYYLEFLPILIDPALSLLALGVAPCFAAAASLIPAWHASKIRPNDLLRQ